MARAPPRHSFSDQGLLGLDVDERRRRRRGIVARNLISARGSCIDPPSEEEWT
jgi:hypothetical protein